MTVSPTVRDAIRAYVEQALGSDRAVDIARTASEFADGYVDTLASDRDSLRHLLMAEAARQLKAQAKQPEPDQPQLWEAARTIAPGVIKRTEACTFAEMQASHDLKATNAANVNRALERDRVLLERLRPLMEGTDLTVSEAAALMATRSAA